MSSATATLHLIEATTGLLLALLLRTLYLRFKHQQHLKYWAWSWIAISAGMFFVTPIFFMKYPLESSRLPLILGSISVLIINFRIPLMAIATLCLGWAEPSKSVRRWMLAGGGLISLATFLLGALINPHDAEQSVRYILSPWVLYGLILAWYTLISIRRQIGASTLAGGLTHLFCLAFALHEVIFGLNRWGLNFYTNQDIPTMVGAFFPLGITLGLMLTVVEAAQATEHRLSRVWEASLDGLCLADKNGFIQKANKAVCRMLNKIHGELEGNPVALFFPEADCQRFLENFQKKFADRQLPVEPVSEIKWREGETLWLEFSCSYVEDSKEQFLLLIIRDISERKKNETAQKQMEAQIRQSHKMEAIGTLAGGIAHDFNNTLGAITGYTELVLQDEAPQTAENRENLRQVLKAARRARDLVKQILTFSRQGEQEYKPVRLDLIVKEALNFLRAAIPANIEMMFHLEPYPYLVYGDSTQIHQVLMNLSTNAIYAMHQSGGRMDMSLTRHQFQQDLVDENGETLKAGEYTRLAVHDNGTGIPPEFLTRIFDPFFTTKPKGEGTGLGLSVVHGIVRNHQGAIRVSSVPAQGSTFEVFLPLIESGKTAQEEQLLSEIPRGRGEWILVVDDEADLLAMEKKMLQQLGYRVVTETNPVNALALFRQQPGLYQAVLTDQTMPNLMGMDLAAEILKIRPGIPVLLCTGSSDTVSQGKIKAQGLREMMLKPFTLQELGEAMARVIHPGVPS